MIINVGYSFRCYHVDFKNFREWYTVHDLEEVKEILDLKEKEYLSNIIKPFRNKVEYIRKSCHDNKYYIKIYIKNDSTIVLPDFEKNTMYKCMETDKEYSLKELGLYD